MRAIFLTGDDHRISKWALVNFEGPFILNQFENEEIPLIESMITDGYLVKKGPYIYASDDETDNSIDETREIVEQFRKAWPGKTGSKPGQNVFWDHMKKKFGKKLPDIAPKLLPGMKREVVYREKADLQNRIKARSIFVPEWKDIKTWVNNRCWEAEWPEIAETNLSEEYMNYLRYAESVGWRKTIPSEVYEQWRTATGPFKGIERAKTESQRKSHFILSHAAPDVGEKLKQWTT